MLFFLKHVGESLKFDGDLQNKNGAVYQLVLSRFISVVDMVNTEAGVRETIDTQLAANIHIYTEYLRATGVEAKLIIDLAADRKAKARTQFRSEIPRRC